MRGVGLFLLSGALLVGCKGEQVPFRGRVILESHGLIALSYDQPTKRAVARVLTKAYERGYEPSGDGRGAIVWLDGKPTAFAWVDLEKGTSHPLPLEPLDGPAEFGGTSWAPGGDLVAYVGSKTKDGDRDAFASSFVNDEVLEKIRKTLIVVDVRTGKVVAQYHGQAKAYRPQHAQEVGGLQVFPSRVFRSELKIMGWASPNRLVFEETSAFPKTAEGNRLTLPADARGALTLDDARTTFTVDAPTFEEISRARVSGERDRARVDRTIRDRIAGKAEIVSEGSHPTNWILVLHQAANGQSARIGLRDVFAAAQIQDNDAEPQLVDWLTPAVR